MHPGGLMSMKRKRCPEPQIVFALQQAEAGTPVAELCRKMGVAEATFYRWKKRYGGLGVSEIRRLRQLEDENRRVKQLVADVTLQKAMLEDLLPEEGLTSARRLAMAVCLGELPGQRTARDGDAGLLSLDAPLPERGRRAGRAACSTGRSGDCSSGLRLLSTGAAGA